MYQPPQPVAYRFKHEHAVISKSCKRCGACNWSVCKYLTATGHATFPWYCMECSQRTTMYEPKNERLVFTAVFDDRNENDCQHCGQPGAEAHHIMPCHLVGPGEADKWPLVYLCPKHHAEWHQIVTPNMSCKD